MVRRNAFTLIELIFAIVIISVVVLSLPVINKAIGDSVEESLVQEAIFASAAGLNEATSYRWDEHSMNDKLLNPLYSRVVHTNIGGCVAGTPNRRLGHIHRRCLDDLTTLPYYSGGAPYSDSVDEASHPAQSIYIVGGTTSAAGYKQKYDSIISITNNASFGTVGDPNVKEVKITIQNSTSHETIVILNSYVSNVGELQYANKVY